MRRKLRINMAFENRNPSNRIFKCKINSAAFEPFGINEGDVVIVEPVAKYEEDQLGIFHTPDGPKVAFAYDNFGDVSLYLKGTENRVFRYPASKVTFLGVAIGIEGSWRWQSTSGGRNEKV